MIILDGKAVSQARKQALIPKIEAFKKATGRAPHLVVILVGGDPASQVYVRNKEKACQAVGLTSTRINLEANISREKFLAKIMELNTDDRVDAVLVQLPLPPGLLESDVSETLHYLKDADGLTYASLGRLWAGSPTVIPCTPQGVMNILEYFKINVAGKKAVVVGRSNIVGKPMAQLLSMADATVTVCHSKTSDLRKHTLEADIVVVAAGKKRFLGKEDFKKGAVVVDVGIHGSGQGSGVVGDVRFEELENHVFAATPVPGGVGPMTITTLLENTLWLAEKRKLSR